jgi:hypothetical protein
MSVNNKKRSIENGDMFRACEDASASDHPGIGSRPM